MSGPLWTLSHGSPLAVAAHDPDGFASVRAVVGASAGVRARNDLAAVPLPEPAIDHLEGRASAWRAALSHGGVNEIRASPVGVVYSRATRRLVVHAALSDFASHAAAREYVSGADRRAKRLWYSAGLCPPLSHSLATSFVVVTADLQLVLMQRSTSSLAGGTWDVGLGESQSVDDLRVDLDGRLVWDPYITARRGLIEELSVRRVAHLAFHTLGVNLDDGSTSLFGVAHLDVSAEELVDGSDAEEVDRLDFVPWELGALPSLLAERVWAPWAPAKIITAAVFCAGAGAARRAGLLAD